MSMENRMELKIGDDLLERLDEWRSKQRPIPTRSAAIREFITQGVGDEKPDFWTNLIVHLLLYTNARAPVDSDFEEIRKALAVRDYAKIESLVWPLAVGEPTPTD